MLVQVGGPERVISNLAIRWLVFRPTIGSAGDESVCIIDGKSLADTRVG